VKDNRVKQGPCGPAGCRFGRDVPRVRHETRPSAPSSRRGRRRVRGCVRTWSTPGWGPSRRSKMLAADVRGGRPWLPARAGPGPPTTTSFRATALDVGGDGESWCPWSGRPDQAKGAPVEYALYAPEGRRGCGLRHRPRTTSRGATLVEKSAAHQLRNVDGRRPDRDGPRALETSRRSRPRRGGIDALLDRPVRTLDENSLGDPRGDSTTRCSLDGTRRVGRGVRRERQGGPPWR